MNTDCQTTERLKNTVLAIVGPTSSGKTSLSINLCRRFNGEVIACDSRNIYRFMDIGTAKPTLEEMQGVTHHLLDVAEPDQVFTVAEYKERGLKAINAIFEKGKVPVVCGGTGFYARALLEGLSIPEVEPNHQLRQELNALADEKGNEFLYEKLQAKDPDATKKINVNDRFRIVRALEVMEALKIPFSKAMKKEEVPFKVIWIGLTFEDREVLKKRIKDRLQVQIEDGLVSEVKSLYEKYGKTRTLKNAVTYKQFIKYFENEITYDEAVDECERHNYQLARKQLIWFRANPDINWIKVDQEENLAECAMRIITERSKIC